MAPEVAYMRYVRDRLIGSTPLGRMLVDAFNAFYYSWSPLVARTVGSSSFLQAAFRILLLAVVLAVHAAALSYVAILNMTGNADAAAVFAFMLAASICVLAYIVLPFGVGHKLINVRKKLRPRCDAEYLHS
jgi:hypothetical protein